MSSSSIQPFLEQAFGFLCDRQFNIDRENWEKFYTDKKVNLPQLKIAKLELSNKLEKITDSEKAELLQQIFCCDPFDLEIIKKLRDIWAEQSPPYKSWSYDLADHLVTISSSTKSELPPLETQKIETINHQEKQANSLSHKTNFELIKIVLSASIIGICIIIALLLSNNRQTVTQSNNPTKSIDSNQGNTINRPDPADFIRNYYQLLANRDYETTWQRLTPNFTQNLSHSDYQKWWNSVIKIQIGNITTISQNNNSAKVKADLFYTTNAGRTIKDKKEFIDLQWDANRSTWLIDRKSSFQVW